MRHGVIFILFISITFGVWASDNGDNTTSSMTISKIDLAYEPVKSVQVEPSDAIIAIFADEDHDEDDLFDDEIFTDAEPFLRGDKDRSLISKDVIEYIDFIIENDADDISDLITEELRSVIKRGSVEESYMVLGTKKFQCTLDYIN